MVALFLAIKEPAKDSSNTTHSGEQRLLGRL